MVDEAAKAAKIANVSKLNAMDPRRVQAHLPTADELAPELELLTEACDDTKRRGAGGTKAGLVGLRPSGKKAFDTFHERYTETGRIKKEEKKVIDLWASKQTNRMEGPPVNVVALPETFCILCFRKDVRPPQAACTSKTCSCCPMLNYEPIMEHLPGLPGQTSIVRCVFCGPCKVEIKRENNSEIQVMHEGQLVPLAALKGYQRHQKIVANVMNIAKTCQLTAMDRGIGDGFQVEGVGS